MIVIPAIDIIDRKPVRLYQGDYSKKEQVGEDIISLSKQFEFMQADYLHMVDLDGAKQARKVNHEVIVHVANQLSIPVEVGGGIRTMEDVSYYLENGVSRVILGTKALEDEQFLKEAIQKYGSRIAVGLDCKDGMVCTSGWLEKSAVHYLDFAKKMNEMKVQTLIVTDISKDGTLMGPNVELLKEIQKVCDCDLIASGGIKTIDHIKQLKALNIYGAITGKAIYVNTLNLQEAIKEVRS